MIMGEQDLTNLRMRPGVAGWRIDLARRIESTRFQHFMLKTELEPRMGRIDTDFQRLMTVRELTKKMRRVICETHFKAEVPKWPPGVVEGLRRLFKSEQLPVAGTSSPAFRITRSLPHGHVAAVLSAMRKLGVAHLLGSKPCPERSLARPASSKEYPRS